MTTKIGWNEFNRFPHDTFLWKGIDGTEVLTHLISTRNYQKPGDLKMVGNHSTTYNGLQNASQLMGTWQRYQDKDVSTEVLTCYGYVEAPQKRCWSRAEGWSTASWNVLQQDRQG